MYKERTTRSKDAKWSRQRYVPSRKVCFFCANKVKTLDYKDFEKLRGYVSERGKIESRRRTGTCAKHQRVVAKAVKRARQIGLVPSSPVHLLKTRTAAAATTS